MATARLWWNGSSWQTTNINVIAESKTGPTHGDLGVRHYIKVAAYDDNTIRVSQWFEAYQTAHNYNYPSMNSTAVTVYAGGSSIGSGSISEKAVSSRSISYNGSASSTGTVNYQAYNSGTIYFSGTISPTDPFRTITYNANTGTGAPDATKVLTGIQGTLSSTTPTKTGYTFKGWSTSQTATEATYAAGGSIITSSNLTLYAVWQANDQTLTITKPATAAISITRNGTAVTGSTVKYDDVLTITATASPGYRILTLQVNGTDFTSGDTHTVAGDVDIVATTIAQSSTIASYNSPVETLGTFALSVNRYSTSHYNKVRYYDSNNVLLATSDVFIESTSIVIPQSWFSDFGTVTAIAVKVELTTYTEPECINVTGVRETVNIAVQADPSMKPTVPASAITLTPYNTGTGAANLSAPGYVKGYSKVQAVIDVTQITHATGASAGSYAISVQGVSTSSSGTTFRSSNILNAAGSLTINCTVTDSRGRQTAIAKTITVNDYIKPAVASVNIYRCDIDGTADENDNYMAITANCSFTVLSDNAISITAEAKPVSGSYTSYGTIQNAIKAIIGGAFQPDISYIVKITVTDTVGNSAYTEINMPRRSWIFHMRQSLGGPGAAFGKVTENDYALQLANGWKFMMDDTIMTETDLIRLLNLYPVGSIYISTNSTSPASLFGGTWARITGKFLLAATDGGAQGGNGDAEIEAGYTGGEATHQLSVSEMASHTHGSKSLTGSLNAYTWDVGGSSGIVTKSTNAKNQKATSGNQVGWINYTINATHEHDNVGSDTAHNNMPPYLAVYVWERTA